MASFVVIAGWGAWWKKQRMQFGEKFMLKIAEEVSGRPKRDWKQKLVEARFGQMLPS